MRSVKLAAIFLAVLAAQAPARELSGSFARERLGAMMKCSAITDQLARTSCYDEAAKAVMAAEGGKASGAPGRPAATAEPAPPAPSESFGLGSVSPVKRPREKAAPPSNRMTARLAARSQQAPGLWRFQLDTGTTWEMTETTPFTLPKPGDAVTIRRGPAGGFLMDVGSRSAVRVARTR